MDETYYVDRPCAAGLTCCSDHRCKVSCEPGPVTCNFNAICEPERGETTENCRDCFPIKFCTEDAECVERHGLWYQCKDARCSECGKYDISCYIKSLFAYIKIKVTRFLLWVGVIVVILIGIYVMWKLLKPKIRLK